MSDESKKGRRYSPRRPKIAPPPIPEDTSPIYVTSVPLADTIADVLDAIAARKAAAAARAAGNAQDSKAERRTNG